MSSKNLANLVIRQHETTIRKSFTKCKKCKKNNRVHDYLCEQRTNQKCISNLREILKKLEQKKRASSLLNSSQLNRLLAKVEVIKASVNGLEQELTLGISKDDHHEHLYAYPNVQKAAKIDGYSLRNLELDLEYCLKKLSDSVQPGKPLFGNILPWLTSFAPTSGGIDMISQVNLANEALAMWNNLYDSIEQMNLSGTDAKRRPFEQVFILKGNQTLSLIAQHLSLFCSKYLPDSKQSHLVMLETFIT